MNSNYRLVERQELADVGAEGFLYSHASGARVLYIKNGDPNKVFSAAFRTVPGDSRGIPHILEHCVLAGSRKYRLKEPFNELMKSSLHTYLNAVTYPDKTVYPIASCNEKDFFNLMDVYLDAVFFPLIYEREETFMQEGWRYTLEEVGLGYNGIVYNEMKGAYSDPYDVADCILRRRLFPDTCYRFDSGGDPGEITGLAYGELLDYHRRYYHPANSFIYFYGDMDIDRCFDMLDGYLNAFEPAEAPPEAAPGEPFAGEVFGEDEYALAEGEDAEGKNYIAAGFVINGPRDTERDTGLSLLNAILLSGNASPLKKALMERGAGEDIAPWFSRDEVCPSLNIIIKNSSLTGREFRDMLFDILEGILRDGLDRDFVDACISRMEFYYREEDFGYKPKGLSYNFAALTQWLYGLSPFDSFAPLEYIKAARGKPDGYFEGLIRRYFLENNHRAFLTILPRPGLEAVRERADREKLEAIAKEMSAQGLERVRQDGERLAAYQSAPESAEALAAMPALSIGDICPDPEITPLEERESGDLKLLYAPLDTRGIIYYDFFFDISGVEPGLLPRITMLTQLLAKLGTRLRDIQALTGDIYASTGGLGFHTEVIHGRGGGGYRAFAVISAKVMADKAGRLFEILNEILNETDFSDDSMTRSLLSECRAGMDHAYTTGGHSAAMSRICGYFSQGGAFRDAMSGIGFYRGLKAVTDDFAGQFEGLKADFVGLTSRIYTRNGLTVGLTCSPELYDRAAGMAAGFAAGLPSGTAGSRAGLELLERGEAFITSSQVQFNAAGGDINRPGFAYDGSMRVLSNILSNEYLMNEIRMKSGAYGCGAVFGRNGFVYLYSYRDPALAGTYEVFKGIPAALRGFEADGREMTGYILGAINPLDRPVHNSAKGHGAFINHFAGITPDMIETERREILSCGMKDIRRAADAMEAVLADGNFCTFGSQGAIGRDAAMFRHIHKL